jgi:ABC-type antimicrobial peptide transport system permease subunit
MLQRKMFSSVRCGDGCRGERYSGMKLATIGALVDIVGALALSSVMTAMLFELTPLDPVSYSGTAAVLLVVAMLACYVPARRAMQVDPIVALRAE